MLRRLVRSCVVTIALCASGMAAHARHLPICFGSADVFQELLPLGQPPDHAQVPRGWTTGTAKLVTHLVRHCFLVPYWTSVEGYSIRVGKSTRYWPLDQAQIQGLQALDMLPTPLPPHDVKILSTVQGWWAVGLVSLLAGLLLKDAGEAYAWKRAQRRRAKVPARSIDDFITTLREVTIAAAQQRTDIGVDTRRAVVDVLSQFVDLRTVDDLFPDNAPWNGLEQEELMSQLVVWASTMTDAQKTVVAQGAKRVLEAEGTVSATGQRWLQSVLTQLGYNDSTIDEFVRQIA